MSEHDQWAIGIFTHLVYSFTMYKNRTSTEKHKEKYN
jgi:hypothetical protein